jgi:hypothetical protein
MKKYLALATAGAMALAVLAATVNSPQAAPWNGNQNWQGNHNWRDNDDWKRRMGSRHNNNWQSQGNWNGPPNNWANNNWKHKGPPHDRRPHFNAAPFFFGFALGALTAPYYYDYEPVYAGLSPHQLWCLRNHPRTYNPATNTFYIRPGVVAVCISPYFNPFPY